MIAQIEAEDKSVQTVDLRTKRGISFKPEDTLNQVLKDDFELVINDRIMPITAPVFTGKHCFLNSSAKETIADLQSLVVIITYYHNIL